MPLGVEHEEIRNHKDVTDLPIPALMPLGVEHKLFWPRTAPKTVPPIPALMPLGVEHNLLKTLKPFVANRSQP